MFKIKAGIAALLVAYALCGVVASSASARWFIEGEELSGSAAVATTATVNEPIKLAATGVSIECKGLNGVKPEIKAPNRLAASSLVFTKCESKEKKLYAIENRNRDDSAFSGNHPGSISKS